MSHYVLSSQQRSERARTIVRMDQEPVVAAAASSAGRQRRLPTKTRSGIITLPTASQQAEVEQQLCGLVKALATSSPPSSSAAPAAVSTAAESTASFDDEGDVRASPAAAAARRGPSRALGDTVPAAASDARPGPLQRPAVPDIVLHPPPEQRPSSSSHDEGPPAAAHCGPQQQQQEHPDGRRAPVGAQAYEQQPGSSSSDQQGGASSSGGTAIGGGARLGHLPRPGPGASRGAGGPCAGGANNPTASAQPSGDAGHAGAHQGPASPPAAQPKKLGPPAAPPAPSRGAKSLTGPLNSSTSPAVVSLPVKRRGSYQSLKRSNNAVADEDASTSSSGTGSVLKIVNKKATHWERFGTILVLYCATDKAAERDGGVLQMMMAEGYDTNVVDCQAEALQEFNAQEVFPDMVLIDADHGAYNTLQLIKQLQGHNPTVAIIVLGSPATRPGCITALQAGAADHLRKPVDVDELMARIERHVQRQHCIKLELEVAMENVKAMVAQLSPSSSGKIEVPRGPPANATTRGALIAVAETDFEEQMGELCEENARLAAKLADAQRKVAALEQRLALLDPAGAHGSSGPDRCGGHQIPGLREEEEADEGDDA